MSTDAYESPNMPNLIEQFRAFLDARRADGLIPSLPPAQEEVRERSPSPLLPQNNLRSGIPPVFPEPAQARAQAPRFLHTDAQRGRVLIPLAPFRAHALREILCTPDEIENARCLVDQAIEVEKEIILERGGVLPVTINLFTLFGHPPQEAYVHGHEVFQYGYKPYPFVRRGRAPNSHTDNCDPAGRKRDTERLEDVCCLGWFRCRHVLGVVS